MDIIQITDFIQCFKIQIIKYLKRSGKYMKKYLWDSLKVKRNQSGIECNKNYHYIDRYLNHTNKTA